MTSGAYATLIKERDDMEYKAYLMFVSLYPEDASYVKVSRARTCYMNETFPASLVCIEVLGQDTDKCNDMRSRIDACKALISSRNAANNKYL